MEKIKIIKEIDFYIADLTMLSEQYEKDYKKTKDRFWKGKAESLRFSLKVLNDLKKTIK